MQWNNGSACDNIDSFAGHVFCRVEGNNNIIYSNCLYFLGSFRTVHAQRSLWTIRTNTSDCFSSVVIDERIPIGPHGQK